MTTEAINHNWQHLEMTHTQESLKDVQLDTVIKGDSIDLNDSKAAYGDHPGLTLVKTVEVWARDPDGTTAEYCLVRESFVKQLDQKESDLISAQLYADGIMANALLEAFK